MVSRSKSRILPVLGHKTLKIHISDSGGRGPKIFWVITKGWGILKMTYDQAVFTTLLVPHVLLLAVQ